MSVTGHRMTNDTALEQLVDREEVLQICYWFEGEGLGAVFTAGGLETFLLCEVAAIELALAELTRRGLLSAAADGYRFTAAGRKEGGRQFADGFADFQRPAHGECEDGCCDGDDHSQCGADCTLQ